MNIIPGYYGVNSIDLMNDLYQKGAHTIVTDRPDLAQQFKNHLLASDSMFLFIVCCLLFV
jgi:glycerophosphoryl diester phosphodiesterase